MWLRAASSSGRVIAFANIQSIHTVKLKILHPLESPWQIARAAISPKQSIAAAEAHSVWEKPLVSVDRLCVPVSFCEVGC